MRGARLAQTKNTASLAVQENYTFCTIPWFFSPNFRGPGRRRKNPEIPPELLNNPFKIYKADTSADQQSSPTHVKFEGAKCASDAEDNGEGKDEQRDNNNNNNGEVVTAFKIPVSQRSVPTMTHPRFASSPNGKYLDI